MTDGSPGFRWEEWANDMRSIAENAQEGIEVAADHWERLTRYHLYVTRLAAFLGKLPDMERAAMPLKQLGDEIDLLVHHHGSDLLRPAVASRVMTTNADKRLRMVATACVRLFRQVEVSEEESRERVAKLVLERGYRGLRGKFDAGELKNWVTKIESGELPGADYVEGLFQKIPALRDASSIGTATDLSRAMLGRIRFPPVTAAQAKKQRPIA